jgi:hypothetical protein
MSRIKDVDALIREARVAGLKVEPHGAKWRVTNPKTGGQAFVPNQGAGRSLANIKAELKRLASPPAPMVAATTTSAEEDLAEKAFAGGDLQSLMKAALNSGVRMRISGGLLHVTGPPDAEPLARLLRNRERDVLALLDPPDEKELSMPKIRDIAHISTRPENVAKDAQALWEILREKAREDGDEPGTNAGVDGVLWRGARDRVVREMCPDWPADYRREIGLYLEQTGHAKCQSRHANPPIWWIAQTWNDGGLAVRKTTPKNSSHVSDEELLRMLADRLARDPHADNRIAELETANAALRSRVEELNNEIAEKNSRLERFEAAAAIFRGSGT